MSSVSIIIVSYNTKVLTAQAIQSVLGAGEIIVVDNDSRDGSPEYLHNIFGKKITILKQRTNGGFAQANNAGIKASSGDTILLLNSDTIASVDAVARLTKILHDNPTYGLLSCRLVNEDGSYQPQGGELPTLLSVAAWWLWPLPGIVPGLDAYQNTDDVEGTSIVDRGWIGGTALMIRREVIEKIGNLDEKIFMYAEDVDFCLRAHNAGFLVGITPQAQITHLGSKSAGSANALLGEVRGLLYLWKKHFPAWQTPLLVVILLKGSVLRWLLFGILRGKKDARTLYGRIVKEVL